MEYNHDIFYKAAAAEGLSDEAKYVMNEVYVQYQNDTFIITVTEEGAAAVKELFEEGYLEQDIDFGFSELYHVPGLKDYFLGVSHLEYVSE